MLDITKAVQTRDGRPARVVVPQRKTPSDYSHSMGVCYTNADGFEYFGWYRPDGTVGGGPSPNDIINVPMLCQEVWLNFYRPTSPRPGVNSFNTSHSSRENADYSSGFSGYIRVACVRVQPTEGDGIAPPV